MAKLPTVAPLKHPHAGCMNLCTHLYTGYAVSHCVTTHRLHPFSGHCTGTICIKQLPGTSDQSPTVPLQTRLVIRLLHHQQHQMNSATWHQTQHYHRDRLCMTSVVQHGQPCQHCHKCNSLLVTVTSYGVVLQVTVTLLTLLATLASTSFLCVI